MITAEEIAIEVKMRETTHHGPFLLVEGGSDVKFFAHQLGEKHIAFIPSYGWKNVVEAIAILDNENRTDVLGIIDRDYRDIVGAIPESINIIMTDSHSIETMMFASSAFHKVLKEKASDDKVKNYADGIDGIRKKVLELGKPIGILRFYSYKEECCYSFENIEMEKFIDKKVLLFSLEKFLAHLRGIHTNNKTINEQLFNEAIQEVMTIKVLDDVYRLCCGHDLMEILAVGLKKLWGSYDSKEISGETIESLFRLAYSKEEFCQSELYSAIKNWFENRQFSMNN